MTMMNAMRSLASFRGESSLFTWLCQICRNQLADARRKAARRPQMQSLEQMTEEKPLAKVVQLTDFRDPLDECLADGMRSAVRHAVNLLPAHYARILELRYGDELTVPEIARVLQISESAAESQLVRARQAFRSEWSRDDARPQAPTGGGRR
jgi:RNA polymerase sigma-70 factor (ECF subfamily)